MNWSASAADYYVAPPPVGSDSNSGSAEQPFATVQRAANSQMVYGDTVHILPGTYREQVVRHSDFNPAPAPDRRDRKLVFRAEGTGQVFIKGSDRVVGWRPTTGRYISANNKQSVLPPTLTNYSDFAKYLDSEGKLKADELLGTIHPVLTVYSVPWPLSRARAAPQQVFWTKLGGESRSLQQLGWSSRLAGSRGWVNYNKDNSTGKWIRQDLRPAIQDAWKDFSFFFCEKGTNGSDSVLYIRLEDGLSPKDGDIEVSTRSGPFYMYITNVLVQGIKFQHANLTATGVQGANMALGSYGVFEDCEMTWMDADGVSVGAYEGHAPLGHGTLRRCKIQNIGKTGFSVSGPNCLVTNCTVTGNNYRKFRTDWHAGGMKLIASPDLAGTVIARCEFAHNWGNGLWIDSIKNSAPLVIRQNYVHDNTVGIFLEESQNFLVECNIIVGNQFGIVLHSSSRSVIRFNTVEVPQGLNENTNNRALQMLCYSAPGAGALKDNYATNNLLVSWSDSPVVWVQKPNRSNIKDNLLDYNFYYNFRSPVKFMYEPSRVLTAPETGPLPLSWRNIMNCDAHSRQEYSRRPGTDPIFERDTSLGPQYAYQLKGTGTVRNPVLNLVPASPREDYTGKRQSPMGRTEPGAFFLPR